VGFFQVFDDGHRLREQVAVIGLQHRHQRVALALGVGRRVLLALHKVHRQVFVGQALDLERDAHAERRRGAEVVVELHGAQHKAPWHTACSFETLGFP
jgi:hypothetical protein